MMLVDINLLLYAVNEDDPHHFSARGWLEQKLSGAIPVGLSWAAILGFIRLSTNSKVIPKPLSRAEATERINDWLGQPSVQIVAPGERHWDILQSLLKVVPSSPNWVTDAHFAALAIEQGCQLCLTDEDFAKFPGLRWINPLQTQPT